jgi:putative ABC transport system permease protein
MLKNYLLTAFREIFKNKVFSAIHILGLALGIAAFVHILQYSLYELSYEKFYDNYKQIYRIRQDRYDKGKLSTTWGAGCSAIGPALKNKFPEVEAYARLANVGGIINIKGDNLREGNFREERVYAVNTDFLTMFPVKLMLGVDSTALDEPKTAVISESKARKFFGKADAIGQSFKLNNGEEFRVTGIFKDIPQNTHLKFDMLISWPTYVKWRGPEIETAWFWDGYYTYVQLKKGTDVAAFEKKMNEFTDKQIEELTKQDTRIAIYSLQPLSRIHLYSNLMWEAEVNGDARTVYFLMVIAFIILIIAWVNYINLSTVKAIFRSREVAMRKISGASRMHLIRQFLVESFSINLIATILAYILVLVTLPFLRNITEREISLNTPEIWAVFAGMIFIGPIVSGVYPALLISSFKPIAIFRGKLTGASGGAFIRKALVVFQFAASITLIAGTFTVYNQLIYMRNQELGVNIDQTLIIKGPGVADSTYEDKLTAFKDELLKYPVIKAISASTSIPGTRVLWNAGGIRRVSEDDSKQNQYRIIGIDEDFIDAYKLNVIKGRGFSKEFGTDRNSVLFNEEALKLMNFETPESALGVDIYFWGENYKIVGVLKNFHQESLKEKFDAIIFRYTPDTRDYFSIKLNYEGKPGTDMHKLTQNTIETIKSHWEEYFPGNPFDYFFLSDHYDQQYQAEKQFRTIFGLFAFLAIVIACLGLFGLSWFIIVQRTKEIGIRKVNGASVTDILLIVSKDFFRLVLLGIIIAAPVTYYLSMRWMEKYPFKVGFNWWLFVLSGLLILVISAITISYNTLAIAHTNPAESINYE